MVQLLEVSKNKTRIHQNIYSTTKTIITKSETKIYFRRIDDERYKRERERERNRECECAPEETGEKK